MAEILVGNIELHVFAVLLIAIRTTRAQGGGGGFSGGYSGGFSGGHNYGHYSMGRSYYNYGNNSSSNDLSSVVFIIFGIPFIIICCCCVYCCTKKDDDKLHGAISSEPYSEPPKATKWLESDEHTYIDIINQDPKHQEEGRLDTFSQQESVFMSGKYGGFYAQYTKTHYIPRFTLNFEDGNVSGQGYDNVGSYNITGRYNDNNKRMALTKTYIHGTGNPNENMGHNVYLRLQWNEQSKRFEGKWYVKTIYYKGSGMWYIYKCE